MLQLVDVAKSFGGRVVLQRMSLGIPEGKTTALLGPSVIGLSIEFKAREDGWIGLK